MTEGRRATALWLVASALAYAAAHQLGLTFLDPATHSSSVWPASGIGLAALLLNPLPRRRALYLALAAANLA